VALSTFLLIRILSVCWDVSFPREVFSPDIFSCQSGHHVPEALPMPPTHFHGSKATMSEVQVKGETCHQTDEKEDWKGLLSS
jgi:hypothetical protein